MSISILLKYYNSYPSVFVMMVKNYHRYRYREKLIMAYRNH